jgi:hypothetical protein
MRDSDSCRPVSPDSCARPAIPPCAWAFAPGPPRRRRAGPGGFGFGTPESRRRDEGGRQVSPVTGEPWWTFAVFLDPGRPPMPGVAALGHGPSARSDGGRAARSLISGLDSTAFALAVYASSSGSPRPTQDALPAACQALPGGIGSPQGSYERFPIALPPSPTYPDARTTEAQPPGAPSRTAMPPTTARRPPRSAATDCSAGPVCLRLSFTYTPSTMRKSRSAPEPSA